MAKEKCFCHLGDYKVKDADARASIEALTEEINSVNEALSGEINSVNEVALEAYSNSSKHYNELVSHIASNDNKFTSIDNSINAIDRRIQSVENATGTEVGRIETLEEKANQNLQDIARVSSDLAGITKDVSDIDSTVKLNTEDIAENRLRIESLENGGGGGGGKMYIHMLYNADMHFIFYHTQSEPFTLATLKTYIKAKFSEVNTTISSGAVFGLGDGIPGFGRLLTNENGNRTAFAITSLGSSSGAPICLMGTDDTGATVSIYTMSEFTDFVTEM